MRRALLLFELHAHLAQIAARASALAVALPIDLLQLVQKTLGALRVSGYRAGLHVRDAFPGLGGARKIFLEGRFGQHQRTVAAVGAQACVDGEQHAAAGIGGDEIDDALGDAGPEFQTVGVGIGEHEHQVGVGGQVELAHSQAAQRDHPHFDSIGDCAESP